MSKATTAPSTVEASHEAKTVVAKLNGKVIKLDYDPADQPDTVIRATLPFQVKSINDEERTIEFIGSTADVDRYGDSIVQAGWEIGNFTKNPVIPWGHNYYEPPVAQALEVGLRDGKLFFKGKWPTIEELSSDPEHPSDYALFCDAIYNAYKGGYLRAFSVGFIPLEYEGNWEDGYVFTKCELLEVSCVTVPANPEALVLAFEEGVISEAGKKSMLRQARKLVKTLTNAPKSKITKGMDDETKKYIDTKFKELLDQLAAAVKSKETEKPAEPSDDTDGGTEDEVDVETLRAMVRESLSDELGVIT